MGIRLATYLFLICASLGLPAFGQGRLGTLDSLRNISLHASSDTTRMVAMLQLASAYAEIDPDSSFNYARKALPLAEQLQYSLEKAASLHEMGYAQNNLGNYSRALQFLLEALKITEDPLSEKNILPEYFPPTDEFNRRGLSAHTQRMDRLSRTLQYAGILYSNSGNAEKSMGYITRSIQVATNTQNLPLLAITYAAKGRLQTQAKLYDSAIVSLNKAYQFAREANYERYYGTFLLNLGRAYADKKDTARALAFYREALEKSIDHGYYRGIVATRLLLAERNRINGDLDSMEIQSRLALQTAKTLNSPDLMIRSYRSLGNFFRITGDADSLVRYQALIIHVSDSLTNSKQLQQFQNIDFNEAQKQKDIENAQNEYRNKVRLGVLIGSIIALLAISIFILRTSRQRQRLNEQLTAQKKDLETAIDNLKKTEKQLVHAEKMASLGELTAGIAHEIQNPLNFVNNFSDLNNELSEELIQAIQENQPAEAVSITRNIQANQAKVLEHGRRAESIVKSMLQHSRSGTGQKSVTDINTLAEEVIALSYESIRVIHPDTRVVFEKRLDQNLPSIEINALEIRRVLLNICNNACYAVEKKSRRLLTGFQPKVIISTKYVNGELIIDIEDNGDGIPEAHMDKIFQPFFTTKPTGEGTGLGLSLGFNMVRANGGDISVETQEGESTTFTIKLPLNN